MALRKTPASCEEPLQPPTVYRAWVIFALVLAVLSGAVFAQPIPSSPTPPPIPRPPDDLRAPSHVIYPTQSIPLRFHHARHLALPGMTCTRCHTNASASTRVEDNLVPPESTCAPCHTIDRARLTTPDTPGRPSGRCELCHVGWNRLAPLRVARVAIPNANLRFSHQVHVSRGQRCESCHGDMRAIGLATRLELPKMDLCVTCHRAGGAPDACAACHLTAADGVRVTRFTDGWRNPPRWMRGMHHDADFWVNHRTVAAQNSRQCAVCHRDDECAACHDGRVRDRRTHPNDYLTQHPIDARMNSDRCASCHRAATFCVACHNRAGVSMGASAAARAPARFHPPPEVWVSSPVTTRHHGVEARRSLQSCVSCHSERDCVTCHATAGRGGGGFSPHPPGFLARCGALLRASERPCQACHDDIDRLASMCR